MKTPANFSIILVGLIASLTGILSSCAQGTYSQPGYGRPDYSQNQPGQNRPDYDNRYDNQQEYNNQPGYDNQQGYGQNGVQSPDFYNELRPHGQWVQTPQYGTVWIPNVAQGFQPYATNGHWVVTEFGNTWVSDYAWGWGPFHYGRWFQDQRMGWAWVPGNDWGPAWVSWRSGGGYYGWAPLNPGFNNMNIPANNWVFVQQNYITNRRIYNYCVPRQQVVNVYQNTTIINNVYRNNNREYASGPRRDEIERVTRQSVPVYRIENTGRPGRDVVGGNSVDMYRPDANRNNGRQGSESRRYTAPFDNSDRGSARTESRYDTRTNNPARTGQAEPETNADRYDRTGNGSGNVTGNGSSRGSGNSRGNAGTYSGSANPEPTPAPAATVPAPAFPERRQSSGRGNGGSYGQPNYEAQQNQPASPPAETYTPPARTYPQPRQSDPEPSRGQRTIEPAPAQWGQPDRQPAPEPTPSRGSDNGRTGNTQPQEQPRPANAEQRTPAPAQPAPGGYSTGRGSSRGNN